MIAADIKLSTYASEFTILRTNNTQLIEIVQSCDVNYPQSIHLKSRSTISPPLAIISTLDYTRRKKVSPKGVPETCNPPHLRVNFRTISACFVMSDRGNFRQISAVLYSRQLTPPEIIPFAKTFVEIGMRLADLSMSPSIPSNFKGDKTLLTPPLGR